MIKVFIIGNLGGDAETRQAGESQVAAFNVASTRRFSDRSGQAAEETEWMRVELWNPGGVLPYLLKGQQVFVEGRYRTEKYTDRDGNERTAVKVIATTLQLLGRREDEQPARQAGSRRGVSDSAPAWQRSRAYSYAPPQRPAPAAPAEAPDDDLPF